MTDNKHFTLLAEVPLGCHDERAETLLVYHVDDEMDDILMEVEDEYEESQGKTETVRDYVMGCLGFYEYVPVPGGLYHRYEVEFHYGSCVLVFVTTAYDV